MLLVFGFLKYHSASSLFDLKTTKNITPKIITGGMSKTKIARFKPCPIDCDSTDVSTADLHKEQAAIKERNNPSVNILFSFPEKEQTEKSHPQNIKKVPIQTCGFDHADATYFQFFVHYLFF